METPYTTLRTDLVHRDFRPLQGDLHISQQVLEQIRLQDPKRLEIGRDAVNAYFVSAYSALCEICYRPEIKAGTADIIEPPHLLSAQSVPPVSLEEREALDAWLNDHFGGGRSLASIQLTDLEQFAREIGDFVARRGPTDEGGDAEEGGAEGEQEIMMAEDVTRDQFMEAIYENKLIFDSEETRRRHEELLAKIRSGEIKSAGDILLMLTFLELEQINTKAGIAFGFKEQDGRQLEQLVPDEGSPLSASDQMRMNVDMMKFSGDANQLNFVMQNLFSNKERLINMVTGLDREMGRFGETVNQAIVRAGG